MAKLHMLKSVTDTINTSFILESGDTLLVFDGGFPSEADYLHDYLKELGGVVTAWFFTHIHEDHVAACFTMLDKYDDITVKAAYYHFPSDEWLSRYDPKQSFFETLELTADLRHTFAERDIPVVTVQTGDVYRFDDGRAVVRVLRTPDETITCNPINNSSTVFRLEVDGKSLLFLGDLGVEGGNQLMETVSPELLRADYVQMAHHGQGGVSQACYNAIHPTYCLWCTPSWLWDNMGPGGYDTGIFSTVIVRGWMSSLHCVKRHYRMTEGTQVIELGE